MFKVFFYFNFFYFNFFYFKIIVLIETFFYLKRHDVYPPNGANNFLYPTLLAASCHSKKIFMPLLPIIRNFLRHTAAIIFSPLPDMMRTPR